MNTTHSILGLKLISFGSVLARAGWIVVLMMMSAHATTLTWTGSSNGLWSSSSNWNSAGVPAAGDTADFSQRTLTGTMYIDAAGGATVGAISFGDKGSAYSYYLKSTTSGGSAITLDNGTSNAQIIENASTAGDSIASTVNLTLGGNGNVDIINNSTKTFAINGAITGTATAGNVDTVTVKNNSTGQITLTGIADGANGGTISLVLDAGSGTILLGGSNGSTYAGAAEIKSGLVKLGLGGGLGQNSSSSGARVTVDSGGTLDLNSKTGIRRNMTLNGTGYNGKGALINSATGTTAALSSVTVVTLASDTGIGAVSGAGLTIASAIDGSGALQVVDVGTVTLSGVNSYIGGTQVQKGALIVSGTGATLGSGNISVSTGAALSLLTLNAVADAANISFAINSIINLGYTGTETIGALDLNGNYIGIGTYTAAALNSYFGLTTDVFTGSGLISVTAVPEPQSLALLGVCLLVFAYCFRRYRYSLSQAA